MNAPPEVVVEAAKLCAGQKGFESDPFGLLALCVSLTNTSSNALATFKALLAAGVSPNIIVCGGETLLQHVITLNRVREVRELLAHGARPEQKNVFGYESTSNLEGAIAAENEAGELAVSWFQTR
ncbi:hypothetical protein [Pseudomarimonas arenosa]|uniref:Ankyrin repeat protein n=1 Tax=Pseudomarimonas arenosa TaxID=2774145 RepID=A0AAW3ZS21_9GAMM|nr:hypothetical protein [Pseudomarimonas arenosa]MBD8527867.1 hypothetical protein [Pseudomarimonas arenosa]